MIFLWVLCFLMYANLFASLRAHRRGGRSAMVGIGHFVACGVAAVAVLLGFELITPSTGFFGARGIAGDAYNWSPVAFLVFGQLSIALFGAKLVSQVRAKATSGAALKFGLTIWAILGGIYLVAVCVDHFVFFQNRDKSGVADSSILAGIPTNCNGMVLIRVKTATAVYRCPNSVRFGPDYGQPFVPWPSYRQGENAQLKARVDQIQTAIANSKNGAVDLSTLK
jgi:hypothetical protein